MYYLFESSVGFFLFKELSNLKQNIQTSEVQKDLLVYEKIKSLVAFEASLLFHGHTMAIDTVESLKKGELPENLVGFLKANLPKKKSTQLAVQDKNLAGIIVSKLKKKVSTLCDLTTGHSI
jgi:hypothetical protein